MIEDKTEINCWRNDGIKVELNDAIDDDFQIASTFIFGATTLILPQMMEIFLPKQEKEEYFDDDRTILEIVRELYSKVL